MMKKFFKKYGLILIGVVIGSIGGWCYWYFIGCSSGQCVITSSPINSTLYGTVMGGLLFSLLKKNKKNETPV